MINKDKNNFVNKKLLNLNIQYFSATSATMPIYEDVTTQMMQKSNKHILDLQEIFMYIDVDKNGNKKVYDVNNAVFDKRGLNKEELESARRMQKYFGFDIAVIRKINIPEKVKCPDLQNLSSKMLEYWDIKGIYESKTQRSKKNKISHAINEAKGQANNIVLDLNRKGCDLTNEEALSQLKKVFDNSIYEWVDNVILFGKDNFVKYYRKQKKN